MSSICLRIKNRITSLLFCIFAFFRNPLKRAKLSAALSAAILLGGIVTWATIDGSLAWFVATKHATAGGMQVTIQDLPANIVEISVHDVLLQDGNTISFKQTPRTVVRGNDTEIPTVPMPTYDLMNDVQRHVLLKITLPEVFPAVSLTASTSTDYFMAATQGNPLLKTDTGYGKDVAAANGGPQDYDNCMTSIIKLAALTPQNVTEGMLNGSTPVYSLNIPADSDYQRFAKRSGNTYVVDPAAPLSLMQSEAVSSLYLLVSYDEDLINFVYADNIGNPALEQEVGKETWVTYVMDFMLTLAAN